MWAIGGPQYTILNVFGSGLAGAVAGSARGDLSRLSASKKWPIGPMDPVPTPRGPPHLHMRKDGAQRHFMLSTRLNSRGNNSFFGRRRHCSASDPEVTVLVAATLAAVFLNEPCRCPQHRLRVSDAPHVRWIGLASRRVRGSYAQP